jgi:hypothetical protein
MHLESISMFNDMRKPDFVVRRAKKSHRDMSTVGRGSWKKSPVGGHRRDAVGKPGCFQNSAVESDQRFQAAGSYVGRILEPHRAAAGT